MKWRRGRGSANVRDRRGAGSVGRTVAGGGGAAAIFVLLLGLLFPEVVPVLQTLGIAPAPPGTQQQTVGRDDEAKEFVSAVLGYTEEVWEDAFAEGAVPTAGRSYAPATLVLFEGPVDTGCGRGDSSIGPFYCPIDSTIYIDPGFYQVLARQLDAPGDFAQAYVIAHEVAHHVQNLEGRLQEVMRQRNVVDPIEANRLTVRLELQADCYAGVWSKRIEQKYNVLERGDLAEALRAAHQVGDDVLQRMSGQPVEEDAFTHGSAEQRTSWFRRGFQNGRVADCDTFSPPFEAL